jgi:copper chaperone CopZ
MLLQLTKSILIGLLAGAAAWANAPAVSRSFSLLGVECGGCVYLVEYSLRETKGVSAVEVTQGVECQAKVTYNPVLVSEQNIAQAVREATPLHGEPYTARLKLRIQGYAEHAGEVQGLFKRWQDSVRVEVLDPDKGELCFSFLPLKRDPVTAAFTGWTLSLWAEAARNNTPCAIVWEVPQE